MAESYWLFTQKLLHVQVVEDEKNKHVIHEVPPEVQ